MPEKQLQPVRGTHDLYGEDYLKHQFIIETASSVAETYGYIPIATPIFEQTSVFKRTLGETSDIVGKEMYTFTDKGGDEVTLRPEGTAGVVRAFISNGMTQLLPLKLIYNGPMFRYERPQKGRLRQFHQLGVEFLGVTDPLADVETIAMGVHILKALSVFEKTTLEINTLGDTESRLAYREALISYFTPLISRLSEDSQTRLTRNPLRILDSKAPEDQELVQSAPRFEEFLNTTSQEYFKHVCEGLSALGIPFTHNQRLVRGLDYYCHTAFEITTQTLGAQGTVLAGGRYDGLVQQMGGVPTPGVGWALGIERLSLMLESLPSPQRPLAVIPVTEKEIPSAFKIASNLRQANIPTDFAFSGNVGKRLKRASKLHAIGAILLGEDELKQNKATVKNLDKGTQDLIPLDNLTTYLLTTFYKK